MLSKILAIVWKDLYVTYTDRNLLLIMIATPLALATIIGAAFSGFLTGGGSDVPIRDIPTLVVNLDEGADAGGTTVNLGQTFVDLLVPPADAAPDTLDENPLFLLTNAETRAAADEARAEVSDGRYAAAIIIPPNFSRNLSVSQSNPDIQPVRVEVYASAGSPLSGEIIRSVTESIANQIATGSISIAATVATLVEQYPLQFGLASLEGDFQEAFAPAFNPASNPLRIEQQTVEGEAVAFNPLVFFGAAQALFFMMFTAMGGANALLEERRDWTLQRMIVSPTPRIVILLGRFVGTFFNCVVQVVLLFLALTLVGSLMAGELQFIWGRNVLGIVLVIFCVALAASGLGILVTALVRTPEQGNIAGGLISMLFGLFSGAFFNVAAIPVLSTLRQFTLNYWGLDAFEKLVQNRTDIGLNLLVLVSFGTVFFIGGLLIFNRRLSI